jgi:DNA-binding transcriptional LysR family regulator
MNPIQLRRDLNLLVVFQALLTERHVGRAATRLALTPSAASHALRRLRGLFDDPLFVRHPKGIEPTDRALALAPRIAGILDQAGDVLSTSAAFDAASPRSFVIATVDPTVPTILMPLIERLRAAAPTIDLRIVPLDRQHVVAAFDRQEIDLAIMNFTNPPARIVRTPVLADRFIGIARRGNPGLADPMTAAAFAALPHLLVSLRGDPTGLLDQPMAALDELGRRVVVTVPHVLAALFIVASTDLVALVFERIARRFAAALDLVMFEPPIAIPPFTIDLLMSAARANDLALQWLQHELLQVCSENGVVKSARRPRTRPLERKPRASPRPRAR